MNKIFKPARKWKDNPDFSFFLYFFAYFRHILKIKNLN